MKTEQELADAFTHQELAEAIYNISGTPDMVACGDQGCVEIWRDANGYYRGAFYFLKLLKAEAKYTAPGPLMDWLKEWCPKVN